MACDCDKLHKRTRCRFVMGGGRHNPADVRSAPTHATMLDKRFEGADLTSAGLWRPPPITKPLPDEFGDRYFEDGEVLVDVRGSRRRADKRHVMKRRDQDAVIEHY